MPISKIRKARNRNPHRGSSFDAFLAEAKAAALKRVFALAIADEMRKQQLNKSTLAKQVRNSRTSLDRLLVPDNAAVTLATLSRAAKAIGQKLKLEFVPARLPTAA